MSSLPSGSPTAATPRSRRKFTVDALFTDHRPQAVGVTDLATAKEIRLDRIVGDPDQPRRTFHQAKLEELAASIAREGVLQPIAVRYDTERDTYVVIHGERRWRAAKLAGLAVIPAVVRDVPVARLLVQQLMENIVRDDLNAVDRAAALRALKSQLGDVPWETVAETVGIRRSRLFQLLGTEKLPAPAQDDIRSGRLSEKQSRALQGLDPESQEALRVAIIDHDLSAEEAMRLSRALRDEPAPADQRSAADVIDRLREAVTPFAQAPGTSDAGPLLAAIATAASGTRADRAALADAANQAGAPAFDPARLRSEILALASSIARAPAAELRPGGSAYGPLAALSGALDAVLNQNASESK